MASGQERVLRRRIRSIQSTRKTTRAMELIAASRIARAQQRIAAARPYVRGLDQLAADVAASPGVAGHPALTDPPPGTGVAVLAIAGDRGLSGAYNSSVLREAELVIGEHRRAGADPVVIAVGRRAQAFLRFRGQRVDRLFTGMTDQPTFADAAAVAGAVLERLASGQVGSVDLISTRFVSLGSQRVERRRLYPLSPEGGRPFDYEMEPERETMIHALVPRVIEAGVLLALLEAAASEHAARQRAMKAATDNADELITTLRRLMNRVRQDSITTEIMDIVGGAEALRQATAGALPELPETEHDVV